MLFIHHNLFINELLNDAGHKNILWLRLLPVKDVLQDIGAHLQGIEPHFFRVSVHGLVLPSVAEIHLISVIQNESAFIENAKSLWRLAVVFVYFRRTIRKAEGLMINRIGEGQFDELVVRKHFADLAPEIKVESIIVVNVQEAASN